MGLLLPLVGQPWLLRCPLCLLTAVPEKALAISTRTSAAERPAVQVTQEGGKQQPHLQHMSVTRGIIGLHMNHSLLRDGQVYSSCSMPCTPQNGSTPEVAVLEEV